MQTLKGLKDNLKIELNNILTYWESNTIDIENGGFIGHIDYPNKKQPKRNKGIILNSRILWAFSAASNYYKDNRYKDICERSFTYLKKYFKDEVFGGVFWEVDYLGFPVNKRKQSYAQAFTLYALSEYYIFSKNEEAKSWATTIFNLLENKAFDIKNNGYTEAFNENWTNISDMRLSEKDENVAKTMNTHLHILEAYTTFYKINPTKKVKAALLNLLRIFRDKFLTEEYHFHLFFDENWNLKSSVYSYGHDVETAWLLIEAAKVINEKYVLKEIEEIGLKVINKFMTVAIDKEGGVMNEINTETNHIDTDRHWWQQAEAIVGLYYAYQITKEDKYINEVFKIWNFIDKYIIDHAHGEWFWLVNEKGKHNPEDEKVGMWKCPYHNSRACIQVLSL